MNTRANANEDLVILIQDSQQNLAIVASPYCFISLRVTRGNSGILIKKIRVQTSRVKITTKLEYTLTIIIIVLSEDLLLLSKC